MSYMDGIVLVRPDAIMSNNDTSVRDEMGIVDVLRSTASYLMSYYLTITYERGFELAKTSAFRSLSRQFRRSSCDD